MKVALGQAFAQTQKAYHHSAEHQYQMALALAHQLGAVLSTRKESVAQALEVGCGTGFLTHALAEVWQERALAPIQCYWLNDLYRAQLVFNPPAQSLGWLMGDVAQVGLPRALDLVVSSSVLQWVADLPAVMARLQAHLNAQGVLAVSVYVGEHYQQLRQTLGVGLDYKTPEALLALLARDFMPLWQRQYHEVRYFPSAQAVLAHVRSTGVGHLRHQVRFAQLRGFARSYEGLRSGLGYPLTYQALQFIGVRR